MPCKRMYVAELKPLSFEANLLFFKIKQILYCDRSILINLNENAN